MCGEYYNVLIFYVIQAPVKREVKEEEETKEVPVSLSVPPDVGLSQSATDSTKYFEPQESSVVVSTNCTSVEVGDDEGKVVPSLDGLSCSPSTFHPSLPTASTSVIVPGTFTQEKQ